MPAKDPAQHSLCELKRQFRYRRPICPFICSTFQDFQVERDILVKKVFPAVDALCRERGTFCTPIDLRWGISDSQVSSGQVISLCLDYVAKCAPFFICILGERFGSHRPHAAPPLPASYRDLPPDAHWMDRNLLIAAASGYDWVVSERHRGCSVTALEVAQRALMDIGDEFSFYYFRQQEHLDLLHRDLPSPDREERLRVYQPESDHCNGEIRDLKASIVKRGISVRYFKTPDELRRLVLEDWVGVVNKLYPPLYQHIPESYRESVSEWSAHEAFAESRRRVFVRTPELSELFGTLTDFCLESLDEPPAANRQSPLPTFRGFNFSTYLRKKRLPSAPPLRSILLLVGERGSGKSSVIANWLKEFSEGQPEVKVSAHFVGCSAHSTDVLALMRRFTHELRNTYSDYQGSASGSASLTAPVDSAAAADAVSGSVDEVSDYHQVCEAFQAAISLGPCVLVLDGIDELGETYGCSYNQVKEMSWLPCPLPPQCKVIVTSAQSDTSHKCLSLREDTQTLRVPLLRDTTSKAQVIKEYLAMHGKCLDDKQLGRIVSTKLCDRPIFLTVLANELRMFGVYSRLDVYLESYLEAASIRDLWSKIVQRWIRDYGWPADDSGKNDGNEAEPTELTGWVADALRLLTVSRNGLSVSEILEMLEQIGYQGNTAVTSLDWALFRSAAMDSLLERPGGLISFFHQHFKEAVEHTLFGSATPTVAHTKHSLQVTEQHVELTPLQKKAFRYPKREKFHKHIADFFLHKDHCCRRSEELPWQLERAGEFDQLCQVLSEPRLFLEMAGDRVMHRSRLELMMYWKILTEAGHDIGRTYWGMLRRAVGEEDGGCSEDVRPRLTLASLTQLEEEQLPRIPVIVTTSPSDGGESEEGHTDRQVTEDTRRASVDSVQTTASTSSYASSVDPSEAFVEGRARGPKEAARLTMSTGQFLSVMSCFVDAERMLLTAHDKLRYVSYSAEGQRLLCGLEESIGNMYLYQLRKDEAAHWYNLALKTVDEHLAVSKTDDNQNCLLAMKGRLLDQLGNMKTYSRDFRGAEIKLTRARECFERSNSPIGRAMLNYHMGFLRMQQGQFESSEVLFLQALSCIERWFGKNHPRVADILNDLASLLCHPENKHSLDVEQAETLYRRAIYIRETCFGPDHLLMATSLFHLENRTKSSLAESRDLLRKALDIRTTKLGEKHVLTRAVRHCLNDLEVTLQSQSRPPEDARSDDRPYSQLTWHDDKLRLFEKRAAAKAEQAQAQNTKRSSETVPLKGEVGRQTPQRSFVQRHSVVVVEGETGSGGSVSPNVRNIAQDEEPNYESHSVEQTPKSTILTSDKTVDNTITEKTVDNTVSSNGHTVYIESFASELSMPRKPQQKKQARPFPTKLRPKSAPVFTNLEVASRASVSSSRTASPAFSSYSQISGGPRRRPTSSSSTPSRRPQTAHRRTCSIPGTHTVDVHNAHCTVYGANTTLYSLLDLPERPRYSATASGIHHTSAWYHIPGRYSTNDRPYPRKRLQRRLSQPRPALRVGASGLEAGHDPQLTPRDMVTRGRSPSDDRSETERTPAVHFTAPNAGLTSGSLLLSH